MRDSLRLRAGDRVAFVLHSNQEAVLKPVTKSVDEVFGQLHDPAQAVRTVAEINAAVAERMRGRSR